MPRPTRWKGCVNGLKGRVRACFICPPIRLTSTPSKWPGPKLSSSCARLKRALWKHSMRRLLRPYKLFLRAMLKASSSMSDSVYDPYGNRYKSQRGLYVEALALLQPTSTSTDKALEHAIAFLLQQRMARAQRLSVMCKVSGAVESKLDLSWVPQRWWKAVTGLNRRDVIVET